MAKLTKTQKEFRKKMKKLAAEGQLVDEFGRPIKKVKFENSFNLRNIIVFVVIGAIILNYAMPFITTLSSYSSNNLPNIDDYNVYQEELNSYSDSVGEALEYCSEVDLLSQKYVSDEPYSMAEISPLRSSLNDLLPIINSNPADTDDMKTATISMIDARISMLNFLEKNLGIAKTNTAIAEFNQIVNQLNQTNSNYNSLSLEQHTQADN